MEKIIVSVRDKKSDFYNDPLIFPNVDICKRAFIEFMQTNPDDTMTKFNSDFAVYNLGTIDTATGIISSVAPVVLFELTSLA